MCWKNESQIFIVSVLVSEFPIAIQNKRELRLLKSQPMQANPFKSLQMCIFIFSDIDQCFFSLNILLLIICPRNRIAFLHFPYAFCSFALMIKISRNPQHCVPYVYVCETVGHHLICSIITLFSLYILISGKIASIIQIFPRIRSFFPSASEWEKDCSFDHLFLFVCLSFVYQMSWFDLFAYRMYLIAL